MRAWGHFAMRVAGLFGIALAMLPPHAGATATAAENSDVPQAVILLPGRTLLGRRLPAFIEVQPGRYFATSTLQRICTTAALHADSVLLFLPDLQLCEQIPAHEQILLRQRLQQLTGRWPTEDPLVRLREQPFVALAPKAKLTAGPKIPCTCPQPPNGVVMCEAQVRTAGAPIATVEYLASDPDGDALTGTFTYQHDADGVQGGLPFSLNGSCTPSPGALQCTINGTAPTQPGSLQLMLTVSDGITPPDLQLMSLLQVLATDDRFFASGFEDPAILSCSR
jgi:hypothetical protein